MSEPSCVICLADFFPLNSDLIAYSNACSHSFHFLCIKLWSQTSNSCPICRTHFTEISATETLGGPVVKRETVETRKQASSNTDFGFGEEDDVTYCAVCGGSQDENVLLLCDLCDDAFHTYCVDLTSVPEGDWYCTSCQDIRQAVPELNGRSSTSTASQRDHVAQRARRNTRTSRAAGYPDRTVLRRQRNSALNRLRNDMRRERAEEAMNRAMSASTRESEARGTKRNVDEINVDGTDVHDLRRDLFADRRFESSVTPSTSRSATSRSDVRTSSSDPSAVADIDKAWTAFDRARKTARPSPVDAPDRTNSMEQRPRFRPGLSNRQQTTIPITHATHRSSTMLSSSAPARTNPIATSRKSSKLQTNHPFSSATQIASPKTTTTLAKVTSSTPIPWTNSVSSSPSFSGSPRHHNSAVRIEQNVALPGNKSSDSSRKNDLHHGKSPHMEGKTSRTSTVGETDDVANSWKSYHDAIRHGSKHASQRRKQ